MISLPTTTFDLVKPPVHSIPCTRSRSFSLILVTGTWSRRMKSLVKCSAYNRSIWELVGVGCVGLLKHHTTGSEDIIKRLETVVQELVQGARSFVTGFRYPFPRWRILCPDSPRPGDRKEAGAGRVVFPLFSARDGLMYTSNKSGKKVCVSYRCNVPDPWAIQTRLVLWSTVRLCHAAHVTGRRCPRGCSNKAQMQM